MFKQYFNFNPNSRVYNELVSPILQRASHNNVGACLLGSLLPLAEQAWTTMTTVKKNDSQYQLLTELDDELIIWDEIFVQELRAICPNPIKYCDSSRGFTFKLSEVFTIGAGGLNIANLREEQEKFLDNLDLIKACLESLSAPDIYAMFQSDSKKWDADQQELSRKIKRTFALVDKVAQGFKDNGLLLAQELLPVLGNKWFTLFLNAEKCQELEQLLMQSVRVSSELLTAKAQKILFLYGLGEQFKEATLRVEQLNLLTITRDIQQKMTGLFSSMKQYADAFAWEAECKPGELKALSSRLVREKLSLPADLAQKQRLTFSDGVNLRYLRHSVNVHIDLELEVITEEVSDLSKLPLITRESLEQDVCKALSAGYSSGPGIGMTGTWGWYSPDLFPSYNNVTPFLGEPDSNLNMAIRAWLLRGETLADYAKKKHPPTRVYLPLRDMREGAGKEWFVANPTWVERVGGPLVRLSLDGQPEVICRPSLTYQPVAW
jgi:hypothetical protein